MLSALVDIVYKNGSDGAEAGRGRRKIENEGVNNQKNSQYWMSIRNKSSRLESIFGHTMTKQNVFY